ncbi:MAG: BTAD domain-containing putative transcriptional regulator [Actinomycetota bacterium]|nr:BTAD domain-containing putative transcriptional regulator [Actinomycetota bacterium]
MRFQLLGRLGAETSKGQIELGPPKQRAVLAILLLHANEIVPTDRIIDLVWGDDPPRTAEHSVQIYVSDLRKALSNGSSSDLIETRPPGYVLNTPPDSVDTLRFEHLVRDGLAAVRTGDLAGGIPKLERALHSWMGSPLADFTYDEFAQGFIRSLEELRSDALESLGGTHLDRRELDETRDLARKAIEADPLREEPRRLMMLALYRSGRQAEALRHYGEYHDLVAEELGIDPSEALRDLEERILLQDPTLNLQPQVAAEGNPYRGLRAFSEEDADVYFGRESLVAEVCDRLDDSPGFVSIVGPSGCGKSSAARAGIIPRLRERGITVVVFQPGARPLWELAGALDRAGFGSRASLLRRFESDGRALVGEIKRPVVLVVDQFEELFTLAETDAAQRFSELVSAAISDEGTPLRVIATLRADYYDKPLSMPALAGVFSDSVVSVKPMTPLEIERAVVEPARAAGMSVDPGLLAQLISDMGDEPGALPLLQVTLFELYERGGEALTLAHYQEFGGLHGALTGGADELLEELDPNGRDLVEQLMMRMVQKGRAMSTARPVPLRDLLDLGVDRVVLQDVLEAFGSRRLITFDRDASGAAVVEMAHEYLISEWPQLETWIEQNSEDLDLLYALDAAAGEWVGADRSEDYLLRGKRLEAFGRWRGITSLKLTSTEARFIEASVEVHRRDEQARRDQAEKEESLAKSARKRLWYFGGAVALLAAAVTMLIVTLLPDPPPDVVLWSEPRDGRFGALVGAGFDRALEAHGLTGREVVDDLALLPVVEGLIEDGSPLVVMNISIWASPLVAELIARHPETQFVAMDCTQEAPGLPADLPNVSCIVSRHDEIGYLAGVAAALTTEASHVGVVVGVDLPFMVPFHEGFAQGVAYVDPDIEVGAIYLTPDFDLGGFGSPTLGGWGAQILLDEGADVIFQAAGDSGFGIFNTVAENAVASGRTLWSIGVDEDQHSQIQENAFLSEDLRRFWTDRLLTSIDKRVGVGVGEAITRFFESGEVGTVYLSIENGGVDYVTSGGYVEGIVPSLEEAKGAIVDGTFELTSVEVDRRMLGDCIAP